MASKQGFKMRAIQVAFLLGLLAQGGAIRLRGGHRPPKVEAPDEDEQPPESQVKEPGVTFGGHVGSTSGNKTGKQDGLMVETKSHNGGPLEQKQQHVPEKPELSEEEPTVSVSKESSEESKTDGVQKPANPDGVVGEVYFMKRLLKPVRAVISDPQKFGINSKKVFDIQKDWMPYRENALKPIFFDLLKEIKSHHDAIGPYPMDISPKNILFRGSGGRPNVLLVEQATEDLGSNKKASSSKEKDIFSLGMSFLHFMHPLKENLDEAPERFWFLEGSMSNAFDDDGPGVRLMIVEWFGKSLNVSRQLQDLLSRMLDKRHDAAQLLTHPWFYDLIAEDVVRIMLEQAKDEQAAQLLTIEAGHLVKNPEWLKYVNVKWKLNLDERILKNQNFWSIVLDQFQAHYVVQEFLQELGSSTQIDHVVDIMLQHVNLPDAFNWMPIMMGNHSSKVLTDLLNYFNQSWELQLNPMLLDIEYFLKLVLEQFRARLSEKLMMSGEAPDELVDDQEQTYARKRKIHSGSQGQDVWIYASKESPKKLIAVKIGVSAKQEEELLQQMTKAEVKNVISVVSVEPRNNSSWDELFATEYMQSDMGKWLSKFVVTEDSKPKFEAPTSQIVKLLLDIAKAVASMHQKGFVHRDIKLENVGNTITDKEEARLLDMGVSGKVNQSGSDVNDQFVGTIGHHAPEMLVGLPYATKPADVYAMGVLAYQALTGRKVQVTEEEEDQFIKADRQDEQQALPGYPGTNRLEVYRNMHARLKKQIQERGPPIIKELRHPFGDELAQLIQDMTSDDPTKRPIAKNVADRFGEIGGLAFCDLVPTSGRLKIA